MTATVGAQGAPEPSEVRPLAELRTSGLLWLINRTVFHPRGFALALVADDAGLIEGWQLAGDGTEVWSFGADVDEDTLMAAAKFTLSEPL